MCPTATRLFVQRSVLGEEEQAAENAGRLGDHRVTAYESQERIRTDYHIKDGVIYQRQKVNYPGDTDLLSEESEFEYFIRRSNELLEDVQSIRALTRTQRAAEFKRRSFGEPLDQNIAQELLVWVDRAIVEPLS